jgi:hypothetical protein
MVESSQDMPGEAQAVLDGIQGLLPREGKFKPDRPWELNALYGKQRVILAVCRRAL